MEHLAARDFSALYSTINAAAAQQGPRGLFLCRAQNGVLNRAAAEYTAYRGGASGRQIHGFPGPREVRTLKPAAPAATE